MMNDDKGVREAFQQSVKTFIDAEDWDGNEVVAVVSRAVALRCALRLTGVKRGDMVCVPCFAPEEVAAEVVKLNAIPVFVGSEGDTWNMNHELLEDAIGAMVDVAHCQPRAVVMCSAYGMPPVVHRICEVCFRMQVPIIDYAAEAMGSEYYGHRLGMFGQQGYGIVAFDGGNALSCSGAALICSDGERKAAALKMLMKEKSALAKDKDALTKDKDALMTDAQAEAALAQMAGIDERISHNRHIQSTYEEVLRDAEGIAVHAQWREECAEEEWSADCREAVAPCFNSNYCRTTAVLADGIDIAELQRRLVDVGVMTQRLYQPLHTIAEYADCPTFTNSVCERLYEHGLCLPSGSDVAADDVKRIALQIKDAVAGMLLCATV